MKRKEHMEITGALTLDESNLFQPPYELTQFLKSCPEPPLYIGLGNMVKTFTKHQLDHLWDVFIQSTTNLNQRVIISTIGLDSSFLSSKFESFFFFSSFTPIFILFLLLLKLI